MRNAERFTAYVRAAIAATFLVGCFMLIDWAAEGRTLEYALGISNAWPPLARLVVICLTVGIVWMFLATWYIIRTATPVDENECPIQVKGKR